MTSRNKIINSPAIKPEHLKQVMFRGSLISTDDPIARQEIIAEMAKNNPYNPMLHRPPIRAIGETESRLYSLPSMLSDSEYMARRAILGTRASFGWKDIMDQNGLREISPEEAERLRVQKNMEILLGLDAHHFQIEQNFKELLAPVMQRISHKEIRLPYETCVFHLNYYVTGGHSKEPVVVIVRQDPETKKITSYTINGELLELSVNPYLDEVYAVCVALDAEIVGKTVIAGDLKQPTRKDHVSRRTFKVLVLKSGQKFIDNIHFVNTGRKAVALHFRRGHWVHRKSKTFWRRSSIVGKIEYGIVDKIYAVK